jgi:hypothetical protein
MKKETIFKHELNESIQANAALNCLKNRNNHKQINEVAPVVAAAGRMLLPMLRPVITKLVQKALVKIGTHARPTQVIKLVMDMLTKGELAKKMAEKCGQTWNEIPSDVKKEIQDAIIAAFKKQAPQEQEEEDYTNDEIPSPNFSYRMSFMVWAMREIIPYLKEISQVCAQADPTELKHAVMKILKTRDTGIPETHRSCQEWAKQNYDWVEMELNGEYDAYREKWSKPLNIPSEQEETTDEKGAFALKLVKKFKNRMTPDYAKRPEMFMMLKLQKALKKPLMSLSKEEYHAWAKAICDACDSVFGSAQEQEEIDIEGSRAAYYSQDEPDYNDDSHGIRLILNMLMKRGDITKNDIPRVQKQIKSMLDANGLWIGDDDHEAERFIEMYWDNQEQEEDGINKGGMHNSVQVGHVMNTPSTNDSLDTEWFSDLEEQEAYYENFRAIAELVADQIDRENGKGIDNNMDTLFAIVREVWNNNPDDLYIWDFDDVQENDCYKFFDKYYETIKNEYLKREHNNIMDATHDDLFASEQEEDWL